MNEIVSVALRVGAALEEIGAPDFLGGSFASSLQGEPRATNDLDFVVELQVEEVDRLVEVLGEDFDIDGVARCGEGSDCEGEGRFSQGTLSWLVRPHLQGMQASGT